MIPIQEHIIRSMIPEWDTNCLLCFLVKNFVYQSLTDLTVMLFSEYLSVSHIDHRDAPHSKKGTSRQRFFNHFSF